MNQHANHERRCINELKRNEACPIDDANHAGDAGAAGLGDTACELARRRRGRS